MSSKLILASTSPFRRQLLSQLGVDFSTSSPLVDERKLEAGFQGSLKDLAEYLAVKKAESLRSKYSTNAIIGCDQVLVIEGRTLSKPASLAKVKERLQLLQGKTHHLLTGLCLSTPSQIYQTTVEAQMTMYPLTEKEIDLYVQRDQAIGCAGGYKIEAAGPLLFKAISTEDHSSIIGLPLLSLVAFLRKTGILGP